MKWFKWFAAVWLAAMGIAPFLHPAHTMQDVWFPLDALLHLAGVVWILLLLKQGVIELVAAKWDVIGNRR